MTKKRDMIFISMLVFTFVQMFGLIWVFAQPGLEWEAISGAENYGVCIYETQDGGYITLDSDSDLIKLDSKGEHIWRKRYINHYLDMKTTSDGGCILVGEYLVKTDADGKVEWRKPVIGNSVEQTCDGGYIIAGWNVEWIYDYNVIFLTKTNALGEVTWRKEYHSSYEWKTGKRVIQTSDKGFMILADYQPDPNEDESSLLIKTDQCGNEEWYKTYDQVFGSFCKASGGGYMLIGSSLVKTDSKGNIKWEKSIEIGQGRAQTMCAHRQYIEQAINGGYVLVSKGDILRTDYMGNILWVLEFPREYVEEDVYFNKDISMVTQTSDGGIVAAGGEEYSGGECWGIVGVFLKFKQEDIPDFVIPEYQLGTLTALLCMTSTVLFIYLTQRKKEASSNLIQSL